MAVRRFLRDFMAPAPDPRRTYRDPASVESELVESVRTVLQQLAEADVESERLRAVERRLEALLSRRRVLEARENAAAVQVRVGEALAGISDELAALGPDLVEAEERAEELEARAAAIDGLLDSL
jgi:phage shock protein A